MVAAENATTQRAFRYFVEAKARIVQSIVSYLLAHVQFDALDWGATVGTLVDNTLAFHIAAEDEKGKLQELFGTLATTIIENAPDLRVRRNLRRSPLSVDIVLKATAWLEMRLGILQAAEEELAAFDIVFEFVSQNALPDGLMALSQQDVIPEVARLWLLASPYVEIFQFLSARDVRIGGNSRKVTIEDAVSICESELGYDCAMMIATLADIAEDIDPDVSAKLSMLQRRMKYGLTSEAEISFFEVGFADRAVATAMAESFPLVRDRSMALASIRENRELAQSILAEFPSYFAAVARELVGA